MWSIEVSNLIKAETKYYASLKQKKHRELEKKFIIEGTHLIEEVLKSKYYNSSLEKVFIRNDYEDKSLLKELSKKNIPVFTLESKTFDKIADTVTPQGIIGVVKYPDDRTNKPVGNVILAFEEINDPGNLGTILRTAYWFNVPNIVLSKNSVEIHNPKVIRGSQGGVFNVIAQTGIDLLPYLIEKQKSGWTVLLTDLSANVNITEINFKTDEKYIIVFGNEASGISKDILENEKFHRIKIRSYSDCESLNVAISVGIILSDVVTALNK